jgi:hypothetical protein
MPSHAQTALLVQPPCRLQPCACILLCCRYYNWRKDTLSDLQLFLLFNVGLFLLGAGIEGAILRGSDDMPDTTAAAAVAMAAAKSGDVTVEVEEAWLNLYSVFKTVFGQEMPGLDSSFIHQASRQKNNFSKR